MQPSFFDAPAQGLTRETLEASQRGAVCAVQHRSQNIQTLREIWRVARTLNEAAELSGLPITSVCSLRDSMRDELEFAGFQEVAWPTRKPTKRCLWRMKERT